MTNVPGEALDPATYRFRGLHPRILLGTASDRYAGWLGQIYSPERFAPRVQRRTKTVGGRRFVEEVLPVESVAEYFEHFPVLELDFTFYRPLRTPDGSPTPAWRTLDAYRRALPPGARLLLKVPREVFARRLWRGRGSWEANPGYLDPGRFQEGFYRPAVELLGDALVGLLFEQEYQKKAERVGAGELARELDRFFRQLPADPRYHVELRTEAYLSEPVFDVLARHGVGRVYSHWTWLPPLRRQLALGGPRFPNRGRRCVVRLMTPRNVRYEDAYARAHPFDRLVPGMLDPSLVDDAAALAGAAVEEGASVHLIVNNRAGGNAPAIARRIAERLLEMPGFARSRLP
ncbi:MAG: DUF72 domain-containing protein [Deferrisomatales bacterium]